MTISKGTTVLIDSTGVIPTVAAFSETLCCCAYANIGDSSIKARSLSISGTVITVNAETAVETLSSGQHGIMNVPLDSSQCMCVYGDGFIAAGIYARVISVSGTTLTVNAETQASNLSNSFPEVNYRAVNLSSTKVLICHRANTSNDGEAIILSVSGTTITQGAAHTFKSGGTDSATVVAKVSSTKAVVLYRNDSDGLIKGKVLSISGTTITSGSEVTVDGANTADTNRDALYCTEVDSNRVVCGFIDAGDNKIIRNQVLTVSGTTFTVGAQTTVTGGSAFGALDAKSLSAFDYLLSTRTQIATVMGLHEMSISGTTITEDDDDSIATDETSSRQNSFAALTIEKAIIVTQADILTGDADGTILSITASGASVDNFTSGTLTARPVDIDADGSQIYIAVLDSLGEPGLIKFSTALDADGTRVFEPGAGTDIGVQCGREDASTIWIAGAFDGTNTVEKSEDSGTSFVVKDPGTFGAVSAFAVGPDSDDRVLVVDDGVDIQETIDDGGEWIAKNTGLTPATKSLARLDINVEEIAFGNESGASDNVDYSINTGADLEDLSLPVMADVNDIIVN